MRSRLVGFIGILWFGGLLLPSTVLAQAGGSISGLVTDTTGGILPGVAPPQLGHAVADVQTVVRSARLQIEQRLHLAKLFVGH